MYISVAPPEVSTLRLQRKHVGDVPGMPELCELPTKAVAAVGLPCGSDP